MKCPTCEEGKLCKIKFKTTKKYAYLCEMCGSFWYEAERIDATTGHSIEAEAKQFTVPDSYEFVHESDKAYQEDRSSEERMLYELSE